MEELTANREPVTWLIILAAMGPWPWPNEIVWKWDLVTPSTEKKKEKFENIHDIDLKILGVTRITVTQLRKEDSHSKIGFSEEKSTMVPNSDHKQYWNNWNDVIVFCDQSGEALWAAPTQL